MKVRLEDNVIERYSLLSLPGLTSSVLVGIDDGACAGEAQSVVDGLSSRTLQDETPTRSAWSLFQASSAPVIGHMVRLQKLK